MLLEKPPSTLFYQLSCYPQQIITKKNTKVKTKNILGNFWLG